jgi:hypothetical protein
VRYILEHWGDTKLTCPVCNVEFSTPYIREAWERGLSVWCPKGHVLEFVPLEAGNPADEQVEELERMFAQ